MMEASHIIMKVALVLFVVVSCARKGYTVSSENNNGEDFIVAVFLHQNTCNASLHFTGKAGTVVQVESPAPVHTFTNLTIGSELSTRFDLNPEHCFDVKNNSIARKGFRITATDGISVSAVNMQDRWSGESYLVLPLSQLSVEYVAVSCPSAFEYSKLMIIASDDDTNINITVRTSGSLCSGSNNNSGQDIKLTLNIMDVFGLFCSEDFTGTYIRSSKPVAVISGCQRAGC
ncbi:uncharacterized protein LOC124269177 [Haliotis rubra]|uniref:uncharacterized protein LOC124269177 n=1 Tax=Haliotis rubra TaxID=36100 RepID=UPI001EE53019|nr:uncharacterized protein LOC124269177 [Haliotis rubra]